MFYNIKMEDGAVLRVGFGDPAQNDCIVREVEETLKTMQSSGQLPGGELLRINGPASLPVAAVLVHATAHLYGTVAIFDPKLGKYVVAISHGTTYQIGELID